MIACPKCNSYMFAGKKRGVDIDCCSQCKGIWLDKGELRQITQQIQDLPGGDKLAGTATATSYPCPRDGSSLYAEPYKAGDDLMVDVCTKCSGVYLDQGELEKIQSLAKQVDEIFTPSWQTQSEKRAQRSEALSSIYNTRAPAAKASEFNRASFIEQVYTLLVATLAVTAGSAYWGLKSGLAVKYFLPALIAEFVIFLIALGVRRVPGLNFVTLFAYTACSGFTLAVVLEKYLSAGHANIIWQAAALTGGIFAVLSVYVHVTKQDFDWLSGVLFVGLIGLVIAGIGFLFWPNMFGMFVWSCVSAVLFSGFILFDTSRIILKCDTNEVVSAVLDLYLDIVNLFLDLLRILSYLQKD